MLRKTAYFIINTISVLIILMAVFILLIVVMTKPGKTPQFGGYMVLRITTGSMEPAYPVDSLILVRKTSPRSVRKGDVISFYSSDPALAGAVNTHRVVAVEEGTDGVRFVTRGDANNTVDRYDVDASDLLGKVEGGETTVQSADLCADHPAAAGNHPVWQSDPDHRVCQDDRQGGGRGRSAGGNPPDPRTEKRRFRTVCRWQRAGNV